MEENKQLSHLLSEVFSEEDVLFEAPPVERMQAARTLVLKRAQASPATPDLITAIAGFLNMKIKLYHAVIATLVIGAFILLFSKQENHLRKEVQNPHYISNIAAVNNSTVMSCINTFVIRK